jgi:hypothetical protein
LGSWQLAPHAALRVAIPADDAVAKRLKRRSGYRIKPGMTLTEFMIQESHFAKGAGFLFPAKSNPTPFSSISMR